MWKSILMSLIASGPVALLAAEPSGPELSFVQRDMTTTWLPLVNGDFGETGPEVDPFALSGWRIDAAPFSRRQYALGQGRNGGQAISLSAPVAGSDEPSQLYQDVATHWMKTGAAAISVSAWIWSDQTGGALLRLSDGSGKSVVSAFHSGSSRWEYLTVTYPFAERPAAVRVSLLARKSTARFAEVVALAVHDDRFDKALPDGCNPLRERVTYRRDSRIRIVIVGNSTINGYVLANKRASIPYLLQLKLEAAYPGRFEVVNFGICAWHLPAQIVTLDKKFNVNLWCDGATWCGNDGQFSHVTALRGHHNADVNTPTIAQLQPDVIVFAGMWNDVWRVLRYAEAGIPPNPDEVNRNGDVPASIDYLRAVFDYTDNPGPEKLASAERALQQALRPLPPAVVANLTFRDYASLRESAQFALLVDNARQKFGFLAGEFVRRARRYGEVWTLALPGRFRDSFQDAARKLHAAGVLPPASVEKFLMNGYVDSIAESIQGSELARVSRELAVPSLDLGRAFHEQYGSLAAAEQFALGYFLENVEDNVHYTYRGNEWVADQVFSSFQDEFARLVARRVAAVGRKDGIH